MHPPRLPRESMGVWMNDVDALIKLAEDLTRRKSDFVHRKGAGLGDLDTADFMTELEEKATEALGDACLPDAPVSQEPRIVSKLQDQRRLWNSSNANSESM